MRKEDREFFFENHLCPVCGKNTIYGDEKSCPECKAKNSIAKAKERSRDREGYNAYMRTENKILYRKRAENGLCPICGKRKPDHGYKLCGICRERHAEQRRVRSGLHPRSERTENGICYFCNNPVKPGYKVCEEHYQMNLRKARSSAAKIAREKMQKEGTLY